MQNKTTDNTLAPGTVISSNEYTYHIESVLGQGTFGITYLASTTIKGPLGRIPIKVAIKEFFMRDINGRDGRSVTSGSKGGEFGYYKSKFRNEARNLSRLDHPGIINVLDAFETNETVYYSMEYIDGGSLNDKIDRQGPLDEKTALDFAAQIADALTLMHSRNTLHLDLKPGNIMMRGDDRVVLIDFGLSKQYDENGVPESSTSIGGGTPGYAPVEQLSYREGKGFPITMDVYALGATMFKMLTGECPPDASDILNDGFPAETLRAHGVSPRVIDAIAHAMAPARRDRTATPAQLIEEATGTSRVEIIDDNDTVIADSKDTVRAGHKKENGTMPRSKGKSGSRSFMPVILGAIGGLALVAVIAVLIGAFSETADESSPAPGDDIKTAVTKQDKSPVIYHSAMGTMEYSGALDSDGKPHGIGKANIIDGDYKGCTYEGSFVHGNLDKGVWVLPDGDWFDGVFVDNEYSTGKYTIGSGESAGNQFRGTFKNKQPDRGEWQVVDLNKERPRHAGN